MNETQLTTKIKEYAKSLGLDTIKIAGGARQRAGLSDLLIVLPPRGRCLWLEVKVKGHLNEVTPLQARFLSDMNENGSYAVAVDDLHTARQIIATCMKQEQPIPSGASFESEGQSPVLNAPSR